MRQRFHDPECGIPFTGRAAEVCGSGNHLVARSKCRIAFALHRTWTIAASVARAIIQFVRVHAGERGAVERRKRRDSLARVTLVLVLTCTVLASESRADCPGSSLDRKELEPLIAATGLTSLDRAFKAIPDPNPAVLAVYHQKRLSLNPTRSEEIRYLESLPQTQADVDRIYELTYTPEICGHEVVSQVVYGMYQTAARLVYRHGIQHRGFIQLCLFANAEVGEVAWPEFDQLMVDDPDLTLRALRALPGATRRSICGGSDPRDLTSRQALKMCHSEL